MQCVTIQKKASENVKHLSNQGLAHGDLGFARMVTFWWNSLKLCAN